MIKDFYFFYFFIIFFSCGDITKNNQYDEPNGDFFLTQYQERNIVYVVDEDSLSSFNIEDSIFKKNALHISKLKVYEQNRYKIEIDDSLVVTKKVKLNITHDISRIYKGFWFYQDDKIAIWKRFIPDNTISASFYYNLDGSMERPYGSFYPTIVDSMFDDFKFIGIVEYPKSLNLITTLTKDSLGIINLNYLESGEKMLILKQNIDTLFYGSWQNQERYNDSESIFDEFLLDENNEGSLLDGYYAYDSIYYFSNIDNSGFYMIINNDELVDNILEFKISNAKTDKLVIETFYNDRKYTFMKNED